MATHKYYLLSWMNVLMQFSNAQSEHKILHMNMAKIYFLSTTEFWSISASLNADDLE